MSESLFTQNPLNSQEEQIESKFQNRHELLFTKENFSQIKEDSMNKELSLGKSFREKMFLQKRLKQKKAQDNENIHSQKIVDNLTISRELYDKCNAMNIKLEQLKQILISFNSNNIEQKYIGLVGLRKIFCIDNCPIQLILDMNILPNIIQLLDNTPTEFIYEALWCLINICASCENQVNKIKYLGGIDKIINLLDHNMNEIKDLAIWNIESFCIDSSKIKNYFIHKKVLNKIITILSINNDENIIIRSISVIKNLIKNYDHNNNNDYKINLKLIVNLVSKAIMSKKYQKENKNIRELYYNCLYILSYLSEILDDCKNALLENGVLPSIIGLLRESGEENDLFLILGCLKIIGNIIAGNANQTQKILDYNIFDILKKFIFHENKRIKKEINWIVSNIAAGTERNIKDLIDNGFFPLICQIFRNEKKDIRIEATWTLCNFSQIKNKYYIKKLLNQGLLEIICECLKSEESKDVVLSLEALYNLLEFGEKNSTDGHNFIVSQIENMGLVTVLENLQYHRNETIYEKALKLIETFFSYE